MFKKDENLSKKTKSKKNIKKKSKQVETDLSPGKKDKVDVPNLVDAETPQKLKKEPKKMDTELNAIKTEPNFDTENNNTLKNQIKDFAKKSYGTEQIIDPNIFNRNYGPQVLTEEFFESCNTLDDPSVRRSRIVRHQNVTSSSINRVVSPNNLSCTKPDQIGQNSAVRHNFERYVNAGSLSIVRNTESNLSYNNPLQQIYVKKNYATPQHNILMSRVRRCPKNQMLRPSSNYKSEAVSQQIKNQSEALRNYNATNFGSQSITLEPER